MTSEESLGQEVLPTIFEEGQYPDLQYENLHRTRGYECVGVDEVGRGCLAGPVVAAAVILPDFVYFHPLPKSPPKEISEDGQWWACLNDSKKLPKPRREVLSALIWKYSRVVVSWASTDEIDRFNILHASMIAMRRALLPMAGYAQTILVDGHQSPYQPIFQCPIGETSRLGFQMVVPIVRGDGRSLSIAAASIVAKVYRDQWMDELNLEFPGYFLNQNKGYSTPEHYKALDKLGPSLLHRRSFAPIGQLWPQDCKPDLLDGKPTHQIEMFKSPDP